jgi:restriction endonuclease Mrr
VRHLRHFGRFEMNKHDVDRQREDRILVAEKEVENHLVGLYLSFLKKVLSELLEEIPLAIRRKMWYNGRQ